MSIIIRPSPGVFRRTMPLVIVFGAFRRYGIDPELERSDFETLTGTVALSRRMHMPLAFSRVVQSDRSTGPGIWLPGCRPKVTDRVFDHPEGSIFGNREFANVFMNITDREIYAAGPRTDSSMQATVDESAPHDRDIRVIIPDEALQKCSAQTDFPAEVFGRGSRGRRELDVSYGVWGNSVCAFEYKT